MTITHKPLTFLGFDEVRSFYSNTISFPEPLSAAAEFFLFRPRNTDLLHDKIRLWGLAGTSANLTSHASPQLQMCVVSV